MGAIQGAINKGLGSIATAAVGAKKMSDSKKAEAEKLEGEILSAKTSLHIANDRLAGDQASLEDANKVANSMIKTTNKAGKEQFKDKASGKFIKRYDYEKAQQALRTAEEQVSLSTSIKQGFEERLAKLTGGRQ